ncbi:hypothetical protein [Streptomyces sp. BA2]|uniref:hypothetical protein n=1 Tax=Streptomyces sp. BA2 TaxID=436595 RepID=UPI001F1C6D7B|nr:hypothetical protein [Streptomyces sp. BA2]
MTVRPPEQPVGPDVWLMCQELIPAGSVVAFLAEHHEALIPEAMFGDMYPSADGRLSVPPGDLASAMPSSTCGVTFCGRPRAGWV